MATVCTIVWFRRDLRIEDNPALAAAARAGTVVPIFIWCPEEEGEYCPGRMSRWWLKQSLAELDESLRRLGSHLLIRRGFDSTSVLLDVARTSRATHLHYNHLYDPISLVRDHNVKQSLSNFGIRVQTFNADVLYEPWEIHDEQGRAFTTFETFWDKCNNMVFDPEAPLLPPRWLASYSGDLCNCPIEDLGLENENEKSSNALLARTWSPGWKNADKALEEFLTSALVDYVFTKEKVDGATSRLSAYLHYGEVSVRKIFHMLRTKQILWSADGKTSGGLSIKLFLKSLGYREYSRYLCFNFPFTHERSLLSNLRSFPWRLDEGYFKAWRQGRTGYPLIDAGMRELWATGWVHNRVRVIVSSFFVKFLQLPWRWGMKYFWDTLLDADLESDVLGWQYISGSLPDGHELDSIRNPQVEGHRLDPEGNYVRRWLPELSRLPSEWIHQPWNAPMAVLSAAGIELGINYPRPIVELPGVRERLDHSIREMWAREAALQAPSNDAAGVSQAGPVLQDRGVSQTNVRANSESSCWDQMVPNILTTSSDSCPVDMDSDSSSAQVVTFVAAHDQRQRQVGTAQVPSRKYNDTISTAESSSVVRIHERLGAVPVWSPRPSHQANQSRIDLAS